jgi:hypothetical protein
MLNDYTLEFMIEKFAEHAIRADEEHKRWFDCALDNGTPIPSYLLDNFNLPRAIGVICSQLLKLKQQSNTGEKGNE